MATDLERLIVSIEANTKQFERAMRSLDRTTDQAMRGVERAVEESGRRQETVFARIGSTVGNKFIGSFRKAFLGYFAIQFLEESIKASAASGDASSIAYWQAFIDATERLKQKIGFAITHPLTPFTAYPNESVIPKTDLGDPSMRTGSLLNTQEVITEIQKLKDIYDQITPEPGKMAASTVTSFDAIKQSVASMANATTEDLRKVDREYKTNAATAQGAFAQVYNSLQDQLNILGLTNREQEIYNTLKRLGADATEEQKNAITGLVNKLEDQKAVLESLRDANQALEDSAKTFAQGLLEGESAADALNDALRRLADALLDMAFKSLFNPGGTPLLQSLFGGFLGVGNAPLGGRTSGVPGGNSAPQFNTAINVSGSVDQKTLAAMSGMIARNNARQNAELQRQWGNHAARYSSLRGP